MKTIFIFFSLLLFMWDTFAQAPIKDWDRRYGGSSTEQLWQISKMLDGDFMLTGESQSPISGDKTDDPLQGAGKGTWLVKMNRDGTYDWVHSILCYGEDIDNRSVLLSNGGIMIGSTNRAASIENACSIISDAYKITKLFPDLTTEWVKMVQSDSLDKFSNIIQLANGNILVVGSSKGNAAFDKTENNRGGYVLSGGYDLWLVWLDENGNIIRDKTIGGDSTESLPSKRTIIELQDGSLLVGATSSSNFSGEKSENNRGGTFNNFFDIWLLKLDPNGNKIWDKTIGGNNTDIIAKIIPTTDGNFLLGGYSRSLIGFEKTAPNKGNYDYWVLKITPDGTILWDKTYGGAGNDGITDMIATPDNGYVLVGTSDQGLSGDRSEGSWGNMDFWLVKIDANGNKIWDKTFGSAGREVQPRIDTIDTDFIIAGRSNGMATGDKSQNTWGDYDYWVLKTKDGPFSLENNILLESSPWKKGIDLRWQTTFPPTDNACFYVQRCTDFSNWQTVDSLCRLVGSYLERTFFYFPDFQPQDGINYYRIVMVLDVGVITSNVVSERWILPNSSPQIYPNPFENELVIEWAGFYPDNHYSLILLDTKGIPVFESNQTAKNGRLVYDLQHLSAGNYNGFLRYGGRKWNIRAVKQ